MRNFRACESVKENGGAWERVFVGVEISGPSGGTWWRVAHRSGLQFLGFVDRGPVDLLVLSVF